MAAIHESSPMLPHNPLDGKIMITAFYEPSTRTRVSFESAWHRMGGDVMSITDPSTTGLAKGESLEDIAEMFSNYGDVMVLRSADPDAIYSMLPSLRIPIVNAGNGTDEHPTQALADIYTLFKWRPDLAFGSADKIKVGIIGNPARMRTVRSFLLMLSLFSKCCEEVIILNEETPLFTEGQREELEQSGLSIRTAENLDDLLPSLDVIYINSIAWVGDSYETLTGEIQLNADSPFKENAIILHPLARGPELDVSIDPMPHNWYFAQARGAVFIRMALLTTLVQRVSQMADVEEL